MPLHYTLVLEPPASRRVRRCALPLLLLGMLAGVLAPGLIAGDRPFQASLCDDLEHAPAAARTASCSSALLATARTLRPEQHSAAPRGTGWRGLENAAPTPS